MAHHGIARTAMMVQRKGGDGGQQFREKGFEAVRHQESWPQEGISHPSCPLHMTPLDCIRMSRHFHFQDSWEEGTSQPLFSLVLPGPLRHHIQMPLLSLASGTHTFPIMTLLPSQLSYLRIGPQ